MAPSSTLAASNSACTDASLVTSHGIPGTPRRSAVSPRRRSCLSDTTTRAPSSMHRCATAEPMPVPAAAVTNTVFPVSSAVGRDVLRGAHLPGNTFM